MKIKATAMKARDLEPGDLFSVRDQKYWDGVTKPRSIVFNELVVAHMIFMRSVNDCPEDQEDTDIFKLTIIK